jgi:hypothetical protein
MPSALVLCAADPASDPRPSRMIRCLARDFHVSVLARGRIDLPNVTCDEIPGLLARPLVHRAANAFRLTRGQFRHIVWTPGLRTVASRHRQLSHDFVAVHDLRLLPVALAIRGRGHGQVLFDAREYYPRQYEDLWWWRLLFQPMNRKLCRRFMARADHVVTVSGGLAAEYEREFGVRCRVLPSLPAPRALTPQPVDPTQIRMIHHGLASPSRQLEGMIALMDHVPEYFSLDMMLVPSDRGYLAKLRRLAAKRRNVRILPPVAFPQLVEATNHYDIGVFLVPPVSFNLKFALPNKFFEYVQARLMVAIGPSPEMAHYVRAHDLGVVAQDFHPATLGAALSRLSASEIAHYKENAHRAAAVLNSNQTDDVLRGLAYAQMPTATPTQ